jgi:hypothetical protein
MDNLLRDAKGFISSAVFDLRWEFGHREQFWPVLKTLSISKIPVEVNVLFARVFPSDSASWQRWRWVPPLDRMRGSEIKILVDVDICSALSSHDWFQAEQQLLKMLPTRVQLKVLSVDLARLEVMASVFRSLLFFVSKCQHLQELIIDLRSPLTGELANTLLYFLKKLENLPYLYVLGSITNSPDPSKVWPVMHELLTTARHPVCWLVEVDRFLFMDSTLPSLVIECGMRMGE